MIRSLVVAVDFSPATESVVKSAILLARPGQDIRLTLLHVIPEDNCMVGDIRAVHDPLTGAKKAAAMAELRKLSAGVPGFVRVDTVVREGFPAMEICATAKEQEADLIVVASHGRTGINRIMMGSTAEEVVHGALCAVMIVKPDVAGKVPKDLPSLQHLAVAFDGSDSSRAALATALRLGRHGTTDLHLIQAVWPFPILSEGIPIETDEVRVQDARYNLDRICDEIPRPLPIKIHVEVGKPWRVIRDVATKSGSDLLIIGAHEHWHLGESILGTTAERVVRHASCSVLVIRPSSGADSR